MASVSYRQIFDDFDVVYPTGPDAKKKGVPPADDPRNKRKIKEVIENCPITVGAANWIRWSCR
jgi:hypothetical protein